MYVFKLGRVVYALDAPVDGGTNLPDLWQPPNGHPQDEVAYAIPYVAAGFRRNESIALLREWMARNSENTWAAGYLPQE